MDIKQRMLDLRLQGMCCSQVIMQMGLDLMGKENPDMITATRGLCNGLESGRLCGTLSAATCLLYLAGGETAGMMNEQLIDWFEDSFGSTECSVLLDDKPLNKIELCPVIVEATFCKIMELFEDNDIELQ